MKKLALLGLMALGTTAAWATSVPAMTLTPDGASSAASVGFSLGFQFNLSSAVTVDSLGFFSPNALVDAHDVGIYTTGGVLLASATVTAADTMLGNFTYHSIAPLVLAAGNYNIVATSSNSDPYFWNPATVSFISGMTFVQDEYIVSGTLAAPDTSYGVTGWFGPSFTVTDSTSATPEPSSVLLLGSGLMVGLGFVRRKKS